MKKLLVDIGNSRMKWAVLRGERLGKQRSAAIDDRHTFRRWVTRAPKFDQVIAVCVAGAPYEYGLAYTLKQAAQPTPKFIRSSRSGGGVTNGYREVWRLGADRWVCAIAAWHKAGARRTVCAVDVGTALTIDVVDQRGRHRGGVIAPGPSLMMQSLLSRTGGIAQRARGKKALGRSRQIVRPLADNTRDAINLGSLVACAALIDRTVQEMRTALGTPPIVYLTGGAAEQLAPLLKSKHELASDLLLQGLVVLSTEAIKRKA
jgi:type III pantothenate kinase